MLFMVRLWYFSGKQKIEIYITILLICSYVSEKCFNYVHSSGDMEVPPAKGRKPAIQMETSEKSTLNFTQLK